MLRAPLFALLTLSACLDLGGPAVVETMSPDLFLTSTQALLLDSVGPYGSICGPVAPCDTIVVDPAIHKWAGGQQILFISSGRRPIGEAPLSTMPTLAGKPLLREDWSSCSQRRVEPHYFTTRTLCVASGLTAMPSPSVDSVDLSFTLQTPQHGMVWAFVRARRANGAWTARLLGYSTE